MVTDCRGVHTLTVSGISVALNVCTIFFDNCTTIDSVDTNIVRKMLGIYKRYVRDIFRDMLGMC